MKRHRILSLLLAIALLAGTVFAVNPVDPSDTLDVYIRTSEGDTLLHTYTMSEMNSLADGDEVAYTTIDNMPWTVKTVASGVYLEDLIDDAAQYTGLDLWDFEYLRFKATDNASGKFTYDDLFCDRYYFPAIHEEGGGINEDGELACDPGTGIRAETMLSISSVQQRLPVPAEGSSPYYPEPFALIFGSTESEMENVTSRLSECKRGVCTMIIDLGDVTLPDAAVPVSGISLSLTSSSMTVGRSLQLAAEVTPSGATDTAVTWKSSKAAVATVTADGLVTAAGAGTAVITATTHDGGYTASCTVTVQKEETTISLNRTALYMAVGDEKTLDASVENADGEDIAWSSSDEDVAVVDSGGTVTAIGEGRAEITAACGEASASCTVKVTEEIVDVTGISLSLDSAALAKGKSLTLAASVEPEDATNQTVYWSSSAPGVASVDTEGRVTAKNAGKAAITATSEDGAFSASCEVTVTLTESTFSDTYSSWAYDAIEQLAGLGFITGYSDDTFRPNESVTREEFVAILVRILQQAQNVRLVPGNTFIDTNGRWSEDYVSTAFALGIVNGYGDTRFGAGDSVTREQIAAMLARVLNVSGGSADFADKSQISPWALPYVAAMKDAGIVAGYTDGRFCPKQNATRAETAALLLRFYNRLASGGTEQ